MSSKPTESRIAISPTGADAVTGLPNDAARRMPEPVGRGESAVRACGRDAARRFIGRISRLDVEEVRAAVATWRQMMRESGDEWFAAEEATARALVTSGRSVEQKPLLLEVAEAFSMAVWFGRHVYNGTATPELRVHATEASGQYLGTVAMLAVLVRDYLEPPVFELLYRPFAESIPPAALARE